MKPVSIHFPKGFLWGSATAAHQVEGGNRNNTWSAWENEPGRILNGDRSGLACDWWGGRWKEDLDRAAEGGQTAHRLSIEWSRIQPEPDRWDEDALDHYRLILRGMRERRLEPMVTLHHFTDPLWLAERGGWENPETPALFAGFTRRAAAALKAYVSRWCTINEPNVYAWGGYLGGGFPPGKNDLKAAFHVLGNLARGHAAAYEALHNLQAEARVGVAINYRWLQPAHAWLPLDALPARLQSRIFNDSFARALVDGRFNMLIRRERIPQAAGTLDFLGVNYYTGEEVRFSPLAPAAFFGSRRFPAGAQISETGFIASVPRGMMAALRWGRSFGVPLYITENGVDDSQDVLRPRYLLEHLHQAWRAVNFNWPVLGYFHWSLVDNFEWERGWTQRFGLWELDAATQARRKRPSAELYAAICRENGITSGMIEQYAPEALERIFAPM